MRVRPETPGEDEVSKPVRSKTWDERHLRYAVDAAEIALMSWNVDTNVIEMDDRGYKLWGMPLIDGNRPIVTAGFGP